jgi:hypothetical protein
MSLDQAFPHVVGCADEEKCGPMKTAIDSGPKTGRQKPDDTNLPVRKNQTMEPLRTLLLGREEIYRYLIELPW